MNVNGRGKCLMKELVHGKSKESLSQFLFVSGSLSWGQLAQVSMRVRHKVRKLIIRKLETISLGVFCWLVRRGSFLLDQQIPEEGNACTCYSDSFAQNLVELTQLPGLEEDKNFQKEIGLKTLVYKAYRWLRNSQVFFSTQDTFQGCNSKALCAVQAFDAVSSILWFLKGNCLLLLKDISCCQSFQLAKGVDNKHIRNALLTVAGVSSLPSPMSW